MKVKRVNQIRLTRRVYQSKEKSDSNFFRFRIYNKSISQGASVKRKTWQSRLYYILSSDDFSEMFLSFLLFFVTLINKK